MGLLTNLISAWELDEASGTRLDSHGTNHLTEHNTVGSTTGIVYGTVADFEQENLEYLSHVSNSDLQSGDIDFTFELWVRLESFNDQSLIAKDTDTGREYTLDCLANGMFRFYLLGGGGNPEVSWSSNASTDVWYHVIGWHDATNNQIGIVVNNATPVTVNTSGVAPSITNTEFNIGSRRYPSFENYADASIGPVRFWKRVLTPSERTELYNGGVGRTYQSFGVLGEGSGVGQITFSGEGVGYTIRSGGGIGLITFSGQGEGQSPSVTTDPPSICFDLNFTDITSTIELSDVGVTLDYGNCD